MTSAQLFKIPMGAHVLHLPTGRAARVICTANLTRKYGWRVEVRGPHTITYITPTNIQDWELKNYL